MFVQRKLRCQKKMLKSFTEEWKANCKEHLGDTFFIREWQHCEGELPEREVKAAPESSSESWEAGTPSGYCSLPRQPSWAEAGGWWRCSQALQGMPCMSHCQLLGDADIVWDRIRKPWAGGQCGTSAKSAIGYMRHTSWCLLSPFFRYSFFCLLLQHGLTSAYTALWLLCVPGCIQAINALCSTWKSQEVNPPSKTHPSPPLSQQSPSFVHVIQPFCLYITLSPAFIHHCPISQHLQIPWWQPWLSAGDIPAQSPPDLPPCCALLPDHLPKHGVPSLNPWNILTSPLIGLDSLLHKLPQLTSMSCSCKHLG